MERIVIVSFRNVEISRYGFTRGDISTLLEWEISLRIPPRRFFVSLSRLSVKFFPGDGTPAVFIFSAVENLLGSDRRRCERRARNTERPFANRSRYILATNAARTLKNGIEPVSSVAFERPHARPAGRKRRRAFIRPRMVRRRTARRTKYRTQVATLRLGAYKPTSDDAVEEVGRKVKMVV